MLEEGTEMQWKEKRKVNFISLIVHLEYKNSSLAHKCIFILGPYDRQPCGGFH